MAEGSDSNLNRPNPPSPPTPKRRRRRRRVIAAVVLLAIFLSFLVHALTAVKEPVYQGKRLSAWLDDRYETTNGQTLLTPAAEKAVQAIGTNALPYLLKVMETRDSDLKLKLSGKLRRYLRIWIPTHYYDRERAMYGFMALGPLAKPAFPEIAKITLESDYDWQAIYSLENAEADTIALLVAGLQSPDVNIRRRAGTVLILLNPAPNLTIPAFTRALNDPDPDVLGLAARALGNYGPQARAAIPALNMLTNTANPDIRIEVIDALDEIHNNTNAPPKPAVKN